MNRRGLRNIADAASLAAILFATLGAHVVHPVFQQHHGQFHLPPALRTETALQPSVLRASAEIHAGHRCLICAFLSSFQSGYGAPEPFIVALDRVSEARESVEAAIPQEHSGPPLGPRAPPATCLLVSFG